MKDREQADVSPALSQWKNAACARIAAIGRFVADFRRRSAFRAEIAQLDRAGNLDSLLDDLGLSRWEMNQMVRGYPEAERLLPTMAYHLDVDLAKLDARSLYALRHTCSLCDAHRSCRRWLSGGTTRGEPAFCPNANLFDQVRKPRPSP